MAESPFGIARRQLHYGLFTTLVYGVVCVIPAFVYYISLARGVIDTASVIAGVPPENMSGFSALIIGTIVMCWNPFGWLFGSLIAVMGIWVTTVAVAAAATALALSVSGTIRFLRAEKPFPKKHLLYVLAMLVPIVNIFAMLRLCGKIKKKEITA